MMEMNQAGADRCRMEPADIRIRPAVRADLPEIARLEKQCFSDPWSDEELASCVKNPLYIFLAAERAPEAASAGTQPADAASGRPEGLPADEGLREASEEGTLTESPADRPGIVGYIGMYRALDEGNIANLAVDPAMRRQGVGRRLLEALLRQSAPLGVKTLFLEVRESNVPAFTLYESLGFCQVGRRRDYYQSPREDARIYARSLP
ncbi:MAG: ribosomal protein S18-alanine N-acetyltransferase [Lachnospiraceae bacterium]|nr:ribosomal protein S18-alanine N-acetyltransferase [Lachnospiraceae bacterium]